MPIDEDIRLRHLLDVAIEEAYSNLDAGPAIIDEILPVIAQQLHDVASVEELYEKYMIELSIGRIRNEALQLDDSLKNYFEKVPDSLVQNIYVIDIDGSQRRLSQENWEFIQSYCRSFVLTNRLIPLFNMVNELLQVRTTELISRRVFTEKYGGSSGINWLIENEPLSASQRPELLMRCGVIEHGLKEDIKNVMEYRNELIHEVGKWGSLESPQEIRDKLELTVSTVESLDNLLSYPPQVRLYRELDPNQIPLNINQDRVQEGLSEKENSDFETAVDVVENELIRNAITNEDSPYYAQIEEILNQEEELLDVFERLWRQELQDAEGEEFRSILLSWATLLKKEFNVNVFSVLQKHKNRFKSRIPDRFLSEEFAQEFEEHDFSDIDFGE